MPHPDPATTAARQAAYRRLALTIIALDVPTLTAELRAYRELPTQLPPRVLAGPARRAA